MISKPLLIGAICLGLFATAGLGYFVATRISTSTTAETATVTTGTVTQPNTSTTTTKPVTETTTTTASDQPRFLGQTPAQAIAQNPSGPWSRDLMIATGTDGITFNTPTTLIEASGVPSAVQDADGKIWVAFQWFPEDDADGFDKIALITSSDNGTTWTEPQVMQISGMNSTYVRPYDPTITLTADGTFRMYFTTGTTFMLDTSFITSATSTDGINYTWEPGARMDVTNQKNYDAAAILFGSTWHLMTPNADSPLGLAYHATSTDGKTFTEPTVLGDETSTQNWTGNLLVTDGTMWFYGSGQKGVWRSSSTDGITWSDAIYTNVKLGDPAVVQLENGSYMLIGVSAPPANSMGQPAQ
jgi:hypothetical protein